MAQTPFSQINLSKDKGVSAQQVSLRNPYLGTKLSYNIDADKPTDDNFLFSARILYVPISGDRWAVPLAVIATPTGGDVLIPESGINVGVFPWYSLISTTTTEVGSNFTLLLHGGLSYKSLKESGSPEINQIRALAGIEVAFTPKGGGAPTTLSVTPVYSHTDGLSDRTRLEATCVIPAAKNLAALIDYHQDNGFRIGIIVGVSTK